MGGNRLKEYILEIMKFAVQVEHYFFNIKNKYLYKKSIYADFAPIDTISEDVESLKALKWALKNKKVRNIALAGPYGAGKSSVIESYRKQDKKNRSISISLATFDGYTWDKIQELQDKDRYDEAKNILNELENELERGILKQLFYKIDANKIPLSRYRKLHHKKIWKYIVGMVSLLVVVIAAIYLVMPDKIEDYIIDYINGLSSHIEVVRTLLALLVVIVGFSYVIRFITSKFAIKQISVGDISAEGEIANTDTVFNKNIDEMLYFFERTKYNVVFIEDLDRFNSTHIFTKLREINIILNQYEVLKRRIVFVYAVRDDLFSKETERTKFFDFIIPVIPVINSTNSGEIMRNLLGLGVEKNKYREYPQHDISDRFITLVSPYIGDMRVLISTINEFWIYKRTLKESQEVDSLKDENMLALMIYKNLYPQDFALIEAEQGDIKAAFAYKEKAIKNAKSNLEKKRAQLDYIQKDALSQIEELKIIILSRIVGVNDFVTSIVMENKTYNRQTLLSDSFSFDMLKLGKMTVYYRVISTWNEQSKVIYDLITFDTEFEELFERYDAQCVFAEKNIQEQLAEYETIDKLMLKLRASTMKQLIANNVISDVIPEKVRENELLVFMLRHGFIDESYADYINYFHPGSISKEELNFILSIRNYSGVNDFSFSIRHCANVIERLFDYEFEQKEVLNYDLLDYMLDDNDYENKLYILIRQISNRTDVSLDFIKSYLERGIKIEKFLRIVCHENKYFVFDLLREQQISIKLKQEILMQIIISCDIEDIVCNNYAITEGNLGCITEYLEKDKAILQKMEGVSAERIKQVIRQLDIHFYETDLEGVGTEVMDFIIEGRYFVLNHYMMESLFKVLEPERCTQLFVANYHCLRQLNNSDILEYVYDNFMTYVETFILGEESNTEEIVEDVEDIILRLFEKYPTICIKVIDKQHLARWNTLDECLYGFDDSDKREIWDYLLSKERVDISWENYLIYHKAFGLTKSLMLFVDSNIDLIVKNDKSEKVTDEYIKELLVAEISDESFETIIANYNVNEFTNCMDEFSETRILLMIEKHYFDFSAEIFAEIKEISRNLGIEFVKANIDKFIEIIDQCDLDVVDVNNILESACLSEAEKVVLVKSIDSADISEDLALKIRDISVLLPKEYVEAAWCMLEEEYRYKLLLNQIRVYLLDEISGKLRELGGVYLQLVERRKHKYTLMSTDYNNDLCKELCSMGYLSPYKIINEKVGFDPITASDIMEEHIVGYVKKKR